MDKSTRKSSHDLDLSPIVKSTGGRKKQNKDRDKTGSKGNKAGNISAPFTTSTPIATASSRKRPSKADNEAEGRKQRKKKKKDEEADGESIVEDSQLATPLASLEESSDSQSTINTSQTRSSRSGRTIKPSRKMLENNSATEDKTGNKSALEGTKKKPAKSTMKESSAPKRSPGKSAKTSTEKSADDNSVNPDSHVIKPEAAAATEEERAPTSNSQQTSMDSNLSCNNSNFPYMDNIVKTEVQVGNETFVMTTVLKTESDINIAHGTSTESSGLNSNSKTSASHESQIMATSSSLLTPIKEEKTDIQKTVAANVGLMCPKQSDADKTHPSVSESSELHRNNKSGLDLDNAYNVASVSSLMPMRGTSPKGKASSSPAITSDVVVTEKSTLAFNTKVTARNTHATANKTITTQNSADLTTVPPNERLATGSQKVLAKSPDTSGLPTKERVTSSSKTIIVKSPILPVSKTVAHSEVNNTRQPPLVSSSTSSIHKKPAAIIKIIKYKTTDSPSPVVVKAASSLSGERLQTVMASPQAVIYQAVTPVKSSSAMDKAVTSVKSSSALTQAVTPVKPSGISVKSPASVDKTVKLSSAEDKTVTSVKLKSSGDQNAASVKSTSSVDKAINSVKSSLSVHQTISSVHPFTKTHSTLSTRQEEMLSDKSSKINTTRSEFGPGHSVIGLSSTNALPASVSESSKPLHVLTQSAAALSKVASTAPSSDVATVSSKVDSNVLTNQACSTVSNMSTGGCTEPPKESSIDSDQAVTLATLKGRHISEDDLSSSIFKIVERLDKTESTSLHGSWPISGDLKKPEQDFYFASSAEDEALPHNTKDTDNAQTDNENEENPTNERVETEVVRGEQGAREEDFPVAIAEESSTQKSLDPEEVFREQMHQHSSSVSVSTIDNSLSHKQNPAIAGKPRKRLKVLYPRRAAPSLQASLNTDSQISIQKPLRTDQKTPSSASFSEESSNNPSQVPNSEINRNFNISNQITDSVKGNEDRSDIESNSNVTTGGIESADMSLSLLEKSDVNVLDVSCSIMPDKGATNSLPDVCPSPTVFSPRDKENLTDVDLNVSLNSKVSGSKKSKVSKANVKTARGNPSRKLIGTSARTRITKPEKLCRHERIDSLEKGNKRKKRWILNTEFESLYRKVVADESESVNAIKKANSFINELVQKANQLLETGQVIEESGDVDMAVGIDEHQEGDSSNSDSERNMQGDYDDAHGKGGNGKNCEGHDQNVREKSDCLASRSKEEKMKNLDAHSESGDLQKEKDGAPKKSKKKSKNKLLKTPSCPEKHAIAPEKVKGKTKESGEIAQTSEIFDQMVSIPTSVHITAASLTTTTTIYSVSSSSSSATSSSKAVSSTDSISSVSLSSSSVSPSPTASKSAERISASALDVNRRKSARSKTPKPLNKLENKSLGPKISKSIEGSERMASETSERPQNSPMISAASSNPAATQQIHSETITKESHPGEIIVLPEHKTSSKEETSVPCLPSDGSESSEKARSSESSCNSSKPAAQTKLSDSSPQKSVSGSSTALQAISDNLLGKSSHCTQWTLLNFYGRSTSASYPATERQVPKLSTTPEGFPSEAPPTPSKVTYQSRGTSPIRFFSTSDCESCLNCRRRQDTRNQSTMTESFREPDSAAVVKEIDFSQITMATDSETGMEFTPHLTMPTQTSNPSKFQQKTLFDFNLKHQRRSVNKKIKLSDKMPQIVTTASVITSSTSSSVSSTTLSSSCLISSSPKPSASNSSTSTTLRLSQLSSEGEASHISACVEELASFSDSDNEHNTNSNAHPQYTQSSPQAKISPNKSFKTRKVYREASTSKTNQNLELNQPFVALERLPPSRSFTSAKVTPSATPGTSPPAKVASSATLQTSPPAKEASSVAPNILVTAEILKDSSRKGSSKLKSLQNSPKKTLSTFDVLKQKGPVSINDAAPKISLSLNVPTQDSSSSIENTQIHKSTSLDRVPLTKGDSEGNVSIPQKVVAVVRICNPQKKATQKHLTGPIKIVPLSKPSMISSSSALNSSTPTASLFKPPLSSGPIKIVPLPKASILSSLSSPIISKSSSSSESISSPGQSITTASPSASSPSKTSSGKDSLANLRTQINIFHDYTAGQSNIATSSPEHSITLSEIDQSVNVASSPEQGTLSQLTPYGRGKRVRKSIDLGIETPTKRRRVSGKRAKNDDGKGAISDETAGQQDESKVKKKPGRKRQEKSVDNDGKSVRKCLICDKELKNLSALKHHMMAEHTKVWHPQHPEGTCERVDLRKILRVLGSLSCEACGKKVKYLPYYFFHLKWCGREEEMMKCDLCGRQVKTMWMSQHERDHRMRKEKLEISRQVVLQEDTSSTLVSGKRNAAIKARSVVHNMVTELRTGDANKQKASRTDDADDDEDKDGDFKAVSESESDSGSLYSSGDEEVNLKSTSKSSVSTSSSRKFTGDTALPTYPDKFQEVLSWYKTHSLSSEIFLRLLPYKNHWQKMDSKAKMRCRTDQSHEFIIQQLRMNGTSINSQPRFLQYSQSFQTKDQVTSYCGGSIDSIEWCPTPALKSTNQYAAVVCHMTTGVEAKITQQQDGESFIQIWAFGKLSPFMNMVEPALKMAILHPTGHVTSCSWCPQGAWQDPDTPSVQEVYRRMGLLAVASLDGHVRVYSVPHPDELVVNSEVTTPDLYQATPMVVLRNIENSGGAGCLVVAWQPSDKCNLIMAGYADGIIRIWNLASSSPLLVRSFGSGTKEIHPIRSFLAHSRPIHCLTWNQRLPVFVSGGDDKKMKFWNLDNLDKDHDTAIIQTPLTSAKWPLLETGVVYGKDHIYLLDRCPTGYQDGGLKDTLVRYLPTNHLNSVWEVDFIDWHNIMLACDSCGSVRGARLRDVSCDQINIHAIAHREFPIFSTRIEPRTLSTNFGDDESTNHVIDTSQSTGRRTDVNDASISTADETDASQSTASKSDHVTDVSQSITSKTKVKKEKKLKDNVYGYKDFNESLEKCCLVFTDGLNTEILAGRKKKTVGPGIDCKRLACYPIESLYSVAANQNVFGSTWVLSGGESGLLRLHNLPGILTKTSKSWLKDFEHENDPS